MSHTQVLCYPYPPEAPRSNVFRVTANGHDVFVYHTNVADFAAFSTAGPVEIVVDMLPGDHVNPDLSDAVVRPVSRGITAHIQDRKVRFSVAGPTNLCLDIPGMRPLLVYVNPPQTQTNTNGKPCRRFAAGKVHDVGLLTLETGETVHIEGGAVVRGCLFAHGQRDVRIEGFGVLDGSGFAALLQKKNGILLERCQNAVIEGLILIEPTTWMVVLGCCRDIVVRNIKEIGEVISSDGIDICGSTDVLVEGCILKNNDDCIVVKSLLGLADKPSHRQGDVARIRVRDCVLLNDRAGNAMEIGFETCTERIEDIAFENCDVLHVHGHGAAFSIHAGDHATIENIRWENIRVEHYFDKLLDFRVVNSRWGRDQAKGRIRNVVLRNIQVTQSDYNAGYSTAVIGGLDETHDVNGVLLENFHIAGKKIMNADAMDLYLRHARNVQFA